MFGVTLFAVFFALVFLNIPIAVALGLSSLTGLYMADFSFAMFPSIIYTAIGRFALLAIPFFILAGTIMEYAGISRRLIRFAYVCVGHRKGGLISVVVVVSCFFAAISGSGPATVAALGGVLIPAMAEAGYDKAMATALISASGGMGIIIPPSIAFVVYASIADVSVGALFSGGFIPGLIVGFAYYLSAMYMARNDTGITRFEKASMKERWLAFKDTFWGLMTPVIILGGIYGGIYTPTEAAGVAVVYGLFVGLFIYKEIKIGDLWKLCVDAAISSGVVMFIVAGASTFAWLLTTTHVASNISSAIMGFGADKVTMLLLINVIFLITGLFLDANSAFYILIPIMMPVITAFKIDPVHFGVFVTVNMAIGLITPPVAINLFVGCNIAQLSMTDVYKKSVPFVVAGVIALLVITFIPEITLFIPRFLR